MDVNWKMTREGYHRKFIEILQEEARNATPPVWEFAKRVVARFEAELQIGTSEDHHQCQNASADD